MLIGLDVIYCFRDSHIEKKLAPVFEEMTNDDLSYKEEHYGIFERRSHHLEVSSASDIIVKYFYLVDETLVIIAVSIILCFFLEKKYFSGKYEKLLKLSKTEKTDELSNELEETKAKVEKMNKKIPETIFGCICIVIFAFLLDISNALAKPIIYIYPEEEIEVSVKLGKPEKVTTSYPQYTYDGWKVLAKPTGELTDLKTGRNLYALYWEGQEKNILKQFKRDEGFIVEGKNTAEFLEEKLSILGLNEREAEEFIVYWLPKMESNKYNFIRFETEEEINETMPLEIEPKPDTVIRVMMDWKKISLPLKVKEQELIPKERNGYTVVEWGGTELK